MKKFFFLQKALFLHHSLIFPTFKDSWFFCQKYFIISAEDIFQETKPFDTILQQICTVTFWIKF